MNREIMLKLLRPNFVRQLQFINFKFFIIIIEEWQQRDKDHKMIDNLFNSEIQYIQSVSEYKF